MAANHIVLEKKTIEGELARMDGCKKADTTYRHSLFTQTATKKMMQKYFTPKIRKQTILQKICPK